jgi:hypothetical protein
MTKVRASNSDHSAAMEPLVAMERFELREMADRLQLPTA